MNEIAIQEYNDVWIVFSFNLISSQTQKNIMHVSVQIKQFIFRAWLIELSMSFFFCFAKVRYKNKAKCSDYCNFA